MSRYSDLDLVATDRHADRQTDILIALPLARAHGVIRPSVASIVAKYLNQTTGTVIFAIAKFVSSAHFRDPAHFSTGQSSSMRVANNHAVPKNPY